MDGIILGKIGSINLVKRENTLQLECVLFGEGFCVNPSTQIFYATLEIDEDDKELVKAEANNKALIALWGWMSAAEVDNLNQLIGQPVAIQVENDELRDFQVISKEREQELLNLAEQHKEDKEKFED